MFKRNVLKIAALCMTLILTLSCTVFAAENPAATENDSKTKCRDGCMKQKGHGGGGFKTLIYQLGLSKADLDKASETGKTIFDLAKDKGFTADQVRSMLIKNNTEAINKALADGKLTKNQADSAVKNMTEWVSKWDGSIHKRTGDHKGMFIGSSVMKELGLTEEELINASNSNKSIYDLAKEKKGLTPEQVKDLIIKSKTNRINEKVKEGKMSKEEADKIITGIKTKIGTWDGKINIPKDTNQ